jgi:DNA-binding beta-propeller fold protein YncE
MTRKIDRRRFLGFGAGAVALTGLSIIGCGDSRESFILSGPSSTGGNGLQPRVVDQEILAFSSTGETYSLNLQDFTVARLGPNGEVIWRVGGLGDGDGLFNFPVALGSDSQGNIYVADRGNGEVDVLDPEDGSLIRTFGDPSLFTARDLAIDPVEGLIFVADGSNHRVAVFDLDGTLLRSIGSFGQDGDDELNFPSGVALAPNGELHVLDSGNGEVKVFTTEGQFVREYGSFGTELGQFQFPRSVDVSANGESFVADAVGGFVTRFSTSGTALDRFQPVSPSGVPVQPLYLSISPANVLVVTGTPDFVPA